MMVATQPNEWNPKLFTQRDQRMTYKTTDRMEHVKDLPNPTPLPGCDSWKTGNLPDVTGGMLPQKVAPVISTVSTGIEEIGSQTTEYPFSK